MEMVSAEEREEFLARCEVAGYSRDEWDFRPIDGMPATRPLAGRIFIHRGNTCWHVDRFAGRSWIDEAVARVKVGGFGPPFED